MINGIFSFTINEKKVSFIVFSPIPEYEKKSFVDWLKEKIKDMKISNDDTIYYQYYHTKKKKQIEILFKIEKLDK